MSTLAKNVPQVIYYQKHVGCVGAKHTFAPRLLVLKYSACTKLFLKSLFTHYSLTSNRVYSNKLYIYILSFNSQLHVNIQNTNSSNCFLKKSHCNVTNVTQLLFPLAWQKSSCPTWGVHSSLYCQQTQGR